MGETSSSGAAGEPGWFSFKPHTNEDESDYAPPDSVVNIPIANVVKTTTRVTQGMSKHLRSADTLGAWRGKSLPSS
ncbi:MULTISPECIES: hypothetical protein [unclassified Microbacterium]|uniref:hypothetical protein n=1 Tax=unclassified Microbacterium TaxID=2609290 RepID=UPI003658587F